MRDEDSVRAAFDVGIARAVIGTRAVESPEFVARLVERFGGERIAVGIDARDGLVATRGWKTTTSIRAIDFAKQVEALGARVIIFTDIATDGMLQGPNLPALEAICEATSLDVIASGGISSREDLLRIEALGRVHGAIIGKALYDGLITGPLRPLACPNEPMPAKP
jgi:phosphoribosylformimino-5-aminoimidazole carboxamide ribotide isomerase